MTAEQVMGAAKAAQLQLTVHELTGTLLPMSPSSAAATTDTGHLLSASAARRIACAADLIPAVLGGPSQILDLGRQNRFFNDHQRTALATLYESCAAADCDRPYAWSSCTTKIRGPKADSPTSTEPCPCAATTTAQCMTPATTTRSPERCTHTATARGRRPSTSACVPRASQGRECECHPPGFRLGGSCAPTHAVPSGAAGIPRHARRLTWAAGRFRSPARSCPMPRPLTAPRSWRQPESTPI